MLKIVEDVADWTAANGEGIYATRSWKVYGEDPSTIKENQLKKGHFGGLSDTSPFGSADIRYTSRMMLSPRFV